MFRCAFELFRRACFAIELFEAAWFRAPFELLRGGVVSLLTLRAACFMRLRTFEAAWFSCAFELEGGRGFRAPSNFERGVVSPSNFEEGRARVFRAAFDV